MFSLTRLVGAMDTSDLRTMEDCGITSTGKKYEVIKEVLNPSTGEFEDMKSRKVVTVPMGMIHIDPEFQERQNINDKTHCVIREQVDIKMDAVHRGVFRADPAVVCSIEGEDLTKLVQLGGFGTTCVCKERNVELREVFYLGVLSYDVAWTISRKLNQNNDMSAGLNNRDKQVKGAMTYKRLEMRGFTPTPDSVARTAGLPFGYVKARFDNGTIQHIGSFRIDRLRKIFVDSGKKTLNNNGIRVVTGKDLGDYDHLDVYVPSTNSGTIYVTSSDYLKATSSILRLVRVAIEREHDLNVCISILPSPKDNVAGEGFFIRSVTQDTINIWINEQDEYAKALNQYLAPDKGLKMSVNVSYEEVSLSTVDQCFIEGENYGKQKEEEGYNLDFEFETDM